MSILLLLNYKTSCLIKHLKNDIKISYLYMYLFFYNLSFKELKNSNL